MKKFFILFFILFSLPLFPVHKVYAEETNLNFAIINYQKPEDLNDLFSNSTRVLDALEGEEIPTPTFLALLTNDQVNKLQNDIRYTVKIIDTHTDINRYALVWHPEKDQSNTLTPLGEVTVITPHHTLVKMPEGTVFTHDGPGAQFFEIPFTNEPIATPLPREMVNTYSPTHPPKQPVAEKKADALPMLFIVLLLLLLSGIVGVLLLRRKRAGNLPPPPNL